jgi:hypothetical protein
VEQKLNTGSVSGEDAGGKEKAERDSAIASKAKLVVAQLESEIPLRRMDSESTAEFSETVDEHGAQDAIDTLTLARDYYRDEQKKPAYVGLKVLEEGEKKLRYTLTVYI